MRIGVIIPTYNESQRIAGLISEVAKLGLEVIVIDDGSSDNTAKIALAAGAKVLINPENLGKGAALIKGYNYALENGFEAVISMDGDGQHACADLPSFIREGLIPQNALVIGNRMGNLKKMPFLRVATNFLMSKFISLIVRQDIPDTQCGFRLIKKELLAKLDLTTSKYETETEILIKAARLGVKIKSIPVKTIYSGQKSQIDPLTDTFRFLRFIGREYFLKKKHA